MVTNVIRQQTSYVTNLKLHNATNVITDRQHIRQQTFVFLWRLSLIGMSKLNCSRPLVFSLNIFSLKPCKPEAPKLLCPFVIIFTRVIVIAFKLVKKHKFKALIHYERTLLLYSGLNEAKRSFRLIKSSSFGLLNLFKSYKPSNIISKVCNNFGSFGLHSFGEKLK